jgi:exopolysaccharide biosynthesis polyprenyl glycosylphosphotransferase
MFPLAWGAAQLALLVPLRLGVVVALRLVRTRGRNYRNVVIVGSGQRAQAVHLAIQENPAWGLRVISFVDDVAVPADPDSVVLDVHKLDDLPLLFRDHVIDEVIVACPRSMLASIGSVVDTCAEAGVPVTLPTDLFGDHLPPPRVTQFDSIAALNFAPVHHSSTKLAVKRSIDIVCSGIGIAALSPVIGLAALLIRRSSPGPVLFRQRRCGLNGREFEMLKLRSMYIDAEERKAELEHLNEMDGPVFKIQDDPRVTPVGRFLRKWSIDEIPQLWNVFRGDMSLVGPRPPVPSEVWRYEHFQRRRLSMRPGITCLWQVGGRNGIGFAEWVKLDLEYIDSWSLRTDLKILLRTLPAVLRRSGAS